MILKVEFPSLLCSSIQLSLTNFSMLYFIMLKILYFLHDFFLTCGFFRHMVFKYYFANFSKYFYDWFLAEFHCGQIIYFKPFKLLWWISYMQLKRKHILLWLNEVSYKCKVDINSRSSLYFCVYLSYKWKRSVEIFSYN